MLLAVGLLIIALLIHRMGPDRFLVIIREAEKGYWLGGVAVYLISLVLRGTKWYVLSRCYLPCRYRVVLPVYLVNAILGNITPFKSGEAAGPVLLRRYCGLEIGKGFALLLADRIFELIFLLFFLVISFGYLYLTVLMPPVAAKGILVTLAFLIIFILIFIFVLVYAPFGHCLVRWFRVHVSWRWLQQRIHHIEREMETFYQARKNLSRGGIFLFMTAATFLCWMAQFIALWLVVLSLHPVSFFPSLASQGIAFPVSILSFIPGGMGITAASYQYTMSLYGYPYDVIVGAALTSRFLFLLLIFGAGFVASHCLAPDRQ